MIAREGRAPGFEHAGQASGFDVRVHVVLGQIRDTQAVDSRLQRKRDLTYMFISHDLRVVASLASHLIVMREGRVVEEGPAAALFKQPKTDYTRALFAAAFRNETVADGSVGV